MKKIVCGATGAMLLAAGWAGGYVHRGDNISLTGAVSTDAQARQWPWVEENRSGMVLFEDVEIADLSRHRVIKARIIQESPDALVLDVTYQFAGAPGRDQVLGIYPDLTGAVVDTIPLQPGRHTVSLQMRATDLPGAGQSGNLRMAMGELRNGESSGSLFNRIVPFAKTWQSLQ